MCDERVICVGTRYVLRTVCHVPGTWYVLCAECAACVVCGVFGICALCAVCYMCCVCCIPGML